MLELICHSNGRISAEDQSTKDILKKGYIGELEKRDLRLSIYEALYLLDMRNAKCSARGKSIFFSDLASRHWRESKFTAKYFTYKDWRERGLVIKNPESKHKEPNKTPVKEYPSSELKMPRYSLNGTFFRTDLTTILDESRESKELYEKYWFGQYGSYKAYDRGRLNKLDVYETLFLMEEGALTVRNATKKAIVKTASSTRKDFMPLYEVYKDWRSRGYVIKTGFKFGAHFRVYFPGARPMQEGKKDWVHSKHVLQVFPKESRLLVSEWARAIRVAHSVRKTFILAVPGKAEPRRMNIDYLLYHRKGGNAENPDTSPPKYAMLSLGEEEKIGGAELAGAIKEAKNRKLELVLAIADRETAVTYYKVRRIALQRSASEYYEIDWMQP